MGEFLSAIWIVVLHHRLEYMETIRPNSNENARKKAFGSTYLLSEDNLSKEKRIDKTEYDYHGNW